MAPPSSPPTTTATSPCSTAPTANRPGPSPATAAPTPPPSPATARPSSPPPAAALSSCSTPKARTDASRRSPARSTTSPSSATAAAPSSPPRSQVISATQITDGTFDLPQPDAWYVKWLPCCGHRPGGPAGHRVLLGLRRRPNGERAWRGYRQGGTRLGREIWRGRVSYLFLLPTVTLLLIFNYYPAFSGIYHAFTVWTPGPGDPLGRVRPVPRPG